MLFTEPAFLFYFLPLLLGLHWLVPQPARNPLLLLASLFFYAWGEPVHVLLLLSSIAFNAAVGRRVADDRRWLAFGVAGNVALLGWFKYAGFLANVAGLDVPTPGLPIGISFFTFQAISYLVDVSRGEAEAPRDPMRVALYISLFPQLIAGPIVRFRDIASQLEDRRTTAEGFASGIQRFTLGLGKKMLIANTLAVPADSIFALPTSELDLATAWLGVACYSLQIYFDFSGYSDMAIGLGRMFGLEFKENFRHPYESRSVREFWRRWHISLSTWFRDYVYIPLGGGQRSPLRVALNLWAVFLLCGLWHGASWNFLLWGGYHGAFLALERMTGRSPSGIAGWLYSALVVSAGWVLFRAETLPQVWEIWQAMAGLGGATHGAAEAVWLLDTPVALALIVAAVGATSAPSRLADRISNRLRSAPIAAAGAWRSAQTLSILCLLLACGIRMASGAYDPFIYFRF